MAESLALLESRRADLVRALANLKDIRPGSVVGAVFRCGQPTCQLRPARGSGARTNPTRNL